MEFGQVALARHAHCVRRSVWHLEWCTKYRFRMMRKLGNRNMVAAAIRQAAHRHGIELLALEVMPEHVHAVAQLPKGMDDTRAARLLKGYSAWKIFRAKPAYRKRYPRGHFWSRGYMARTVGVDEEKMIRYVLSQQEHHGVTFH